MAKCPDFSKAERFSVDRKPHVCYNTGVEVVGLKCGLISAFALAVLLALAPVCNASEHFILEPGTHQITIAGQDFEITTEVLIDLAFEFVDEYRVAGVITVLDSLGYGWVRLFWVQQDAVIIDDVIEGTVDFDYNSSETGHAERNHIPRLGPTMAVGRRES